MKKIIVTCFLVISLLLFGQKSCAIESKNSESYTYSSKAESKATIGFSNKNIQKGGGGVKPLLPSSGSSGSSGSSISSKLPSTGESVGIGLMVLGLIFIIIFFSKELQSMIKNKNNKHKERV